MGDSAAPNPAKARLLARVAADAGAAAVAEAARRKAIASRNDAALQAAQAGATYRELGQAAGLQKMAVYKMLNGANGGKLRNEASEQQASS